MKESGPAASAELRIGDIIQSVSRKRIQNLDTLERALNAAGPGNCQLRINRAGKEIQARVKLRIRPGDAAGIWE
jgi:S1-C subfamily serine protease